jgi:hypothetical protein
LLSHGLVYNIEYFQAVARAARLAVLYQQRFGKDVFVDVLCWRHHGHNELDNPRLTNPRMYNIVDAKTLVVITSLCFNDFSHEDSLQGFEETLILN